VPAGQGRCSARATGAASARAGWCGPGSGVAGAVARVEAMREREEQEKERARLGTILTYVCRADTSADEHKRASLRGGRVGFKIDERNLKYELRL
jgi:hypothetical protein